MPIKCFFDGSDSSHTKIKLLTLAVVVADESVWSQIEPAWENVLKSHNAPFSHMADLYAEQEPFDGWSRGQRLAFVQALCRILEPFKRNPKIRKYTVSVDLNARAKWKKVKNHPSPERLCARIAFHTLLKEFPGIIDVIDMWFDHNEKFMRHLQEDWRNPAIKRKFPTWKIVRTIAEADMRTTIPLQVADMMAWSRNRIETHDSAPRFDEQYNVAEWSLGALAGASARVTERHLARITYPIDGLVRENLFRAARKRHR